MAYMCGQLNLEQQDQWIKQDLENILRCVPSYLDIILEEVAKLIAEFKNRATHKRLSGHNILGLIQFSQNLMQLGWALPDPFHQLPNI